MKSSNIGGQAVMEGIMMRHKDKYSIAVRRPDNEIELKVEDYKCVFGNAKFLKYPLIRGVVSFVDSLVVGTKCLMYSAEIAGDEEDEEEDEEIEAHGPNPYVTYSRNDLENLDPAYAITIHKSQGSEFPAVIMPFLNSHFVMLERNLLYTGVTRAKKYLFLKGQRNAIYKAVKTISMLSRNSNLRTKLQGDFGQISFFGENMGLY